MYKDRTTLATPKLKEKFFKFKKKHRYQILLCLISKHRNSEVASQNVQDFRPAIYAS